jgi:hypothetical protein
LKFDCDNGACRSICNLAVSSPDLYPVASLAELVRRKGEPIVDAPRATQVAVIGMACRLPGAIDSPQKLWEALLRGDDFVTVATNRDGFD